MNRLLFALAATPAFVAPARALDALQSTTVSGRPPPALCSATLGGLLINRADGTLPYCDPSGALKTRALPDPAGILQVGGINSSGPVSGSTLAGDGSAGIAATATNGTVGRLLKDRASQLLSVKDFGAKGDSTTDDTAAFQAAINTVASLGAFLTNGNAQMRIPCGNYILAGNLIANVAGSKSFVIAGEVRDCVKLTFKGQTGTALTVNYGDRFSSFHLSDLAYTVDTDTTTSVGVRLVNANPVGPTGTSRSSFNRVIFRGADGRQVVNHWGTMMQASMVSNIDFNQVDGYGAGTNSTTIAQGISIKGDSTLANFAGYVVSFNFNDGNLNGFDKAISLGDATQGTFINGTNWNAVNYGVYVPAGLTGLDGVLVSGTPGASAKIANVAVLSTDARNVVIKGNYFLLSQPSCIGVRSAAIGSIIQGNGFEGISSANPGVGVDLIDGATGSAVSGNFYSYLTTGNALSSQTSNNILTGNSYANVTTQTNDAGTTNTLVEAVPASGGRLRIQHNGTTVGPSFQLNGPGVSRAWNLGIAGSIQGPTVGSLGVYDATAGSYRTVWDPSGNMGIGTLGPGARLDVQGGNFRNIDAASNSYKTDGAGNFSITPGSISTNPGFGLFGTENGAHAFYMLYAQAAAGWQLYDGTSAATRIHVANNGLVGVGTTGPGALLDVNGTLRGKMLSLAAAPTVTDIPASYWTVVKRTDDTSVKVCANDAGTIKCATLQ
ncbi:glycoside hydrolase family 55 protein [Methylobacterium sp. E-065]|uniref:glycoside hydrolase family 55 protein n=1 Tax=Methylobacterium sp. E-065 TaxID=2836583 RepID=UPI001FB9B131|nr:glycoside hydrolase family 55 protein [Methylobacterium sp. E-065]MCJ2020528.1 glycoside hydrolase family 55 protein [Methylobacterium sp. E-065]